MECWNQNNSLTYKTLKPLLWMMSALCITRDLTVGKVKFVGQIILTLIVLTVWLTFSAKNIWCFIGAENAMNKNSTILNFVMLLATSVGAFHVIVGFVYRPHTVKRFLLFCDELRMDPHFELSYSRLERKIKITCIFGLVFMIIMSIIFAFANPLFLPSHQISCLQSPVLDPQNWLFIVNGIFFMIGVFTFSGQALFIPLFFIFICSIIRLEFKRCNDEFKKCIDMPVSEKEIEIIKSRYFKVTKLVEEADCMLLLFTSISVTLDLGAICAYIHAFTHGLLNSIEATSYAIVCALALFDLSIYLLQGSSVHEHSQICLETARMIDTTRLNQKALTGVLYFVENMKFSFSGLSIFKLFLLDKTAILTIGGTLISYIIVVIQLKPE